MTETENVPEWAITKALKLMEYGGLPLATVLAQPNEHYEVIAFARYIAAHEEAPVDPVLLEARVLTERWWPEEGALEGKLDDSMWTQRLMFALKRGIELAREHSQ